MIINKQFFSTCVLSALLLVTPPVSATLIQVDAQGTVDTEYFFSADYLALGTLVDASIVFGAEGFAPDDATIVSASGAFTWNDGTDRAFTLDGGGSIRFMSYTGLVTIGFTGTGPVINDITPDFFGVTFDVGTNPFLATDPWENLLLGASVHDIYLMASRADGYGFGADLISEDISGTISAAGVPEPSSLALISFGLAALGLSRRRKAPASRS